jgi:hypothetical protein
MHGDDLGIAGQFGREEDDGYEDEQRTEHIHIVWNEVQVIVEDDLSERNLRLKEIVHLLRDIEYDRYRENQYQGEEEGP